MVKKFTNVILLFVVANSIFFGIDLVESQHHQQPEHVAVEALGDDPGPGGLI